MSDAEFESVEVDLSDYFAPANLDPDGEFARYAELLSRRNEAMALLREARAAMVWMRGQSSVVCDLLARIDAVLGKATTEGEG